MCIIPTGQAYICSRCLFFWYIFIFQHNRKFFPIFRVSAPTYVCTTAINRYQPTATRLIIMYWLTFDYISASFAFNHVLYYFHIYNPSFCERHQCVMKQLHWLSLSILVSFWYYFYKTDILQNTWRWVAGLYSGNLVFIYVVGHPLRHQWVAHYSSP